MSSLTIDDIRFLEEQFRSAVDCLCIGGPHHNQVVRRENREIPRYLEFSVMSPNEPICKVVRYIATPFIVPHRRESPFTVFVYAGVHLEMGKEELDAVIAQALADRQWNVRLKDKCEEAKARGAGSGVSGGMGSRWRTDLRSESKGS